MNATGRLPRTATLAVLALTAACSAGPTSTGAPTPAAGDPNAASTPTATASPTTKPTTEYVTTLCTGYSRASSKAQADVKRLAGDAAPQSSAAVVAAVRAVRGSIQTFGQELDAAAPPSFEGGALLAERVRAGFTRAFQGLDEIERTVTALSPADPDFAVKLTGQALGMHFALAYIPLSLLDAEAVAALPDDPPPADVARVSPGYLGLLRDARDRPECKWMLEGSEGQVAALLDD